MGIAGGNIDGGSSDTLSALISMVANPAEFQARHKELTELKAQADASVALVGPAGEILKMREEFSQRLKSFAATEAASATAREETLSVARADAAKILAEAQAKAEQIEQEAKEHLAQAIAARENAAAYEATVGSIRDALALREKKVLDAEAALGARAAQVSASEQVLQQRIEAISSIHTKAQADLASL